MNQMIVNLRGTSGSGKTTLIKKVMSLCEDVKPVIHASRKQPLGYTMHYAALDGRRSLFIPGHYETACGGCDTLSKYLPGVLSKESTAVKPNSYDLSFGLIREYYANGFNVLFEGLLISGDVARTKLLHEDKLPVNVLWFDLPVELCIASILERRRAKGNNEPLDETNTRAKHKLLRNCAEKLSKAGVPVHSSTDREAALACVLLLLGLATDPLADRSASGL